MHEINFLFCLLASRRQEYKYACESISEDYFSSDEVRSIYRDIRGYYERHPEIDSVPFLDLKNRNEFIKNLEVFDFNTFSSLMSGEVEPLGMRLYSDLDKSIDDLLLGRLKECLLSIEDGDLGVVEKVFREVSQLLTKIKERQREGAQSIKDLIDLNQLIMDDFTDDRLISTGIHRIDDYILGVSRGSITVLVSRPGHGKTALGLQCALNIAKNHSEEQSIYFSKEQLNREMVDRVIQSITGINMVQYRLKQNQVQIDGIYKDRHEAHDLLRRLDADWDKKIPSNLLFIDKGYSSVDDIYNFLRKHHEVAEKPITNIIIDHWNLLIPSGDGNKTERQEEAGARLVELVKEFDCHCHLLCQARKASNQKGSNIPATLDDIKGSAVVREIARQAWVLHNPSQEECSSDGEDENNEASLIIAKSRQTAAGTRIKMDFVGEKQKFKEW